MKLSARISKLEQRPGAKPCPACGQVDLKTGEGLFSPGVIFDQDDGTHCCMCKRCGRSFRGKVTFLPGFDFVVGGWVAMSEAAPAEFPV